MDGLPGMRKGLETAEKEKVAPITKMVGRRDADVRIHDMHLLNEMHTGRSPCTGHSSWPWIIQAGVAGTF